MVIWDYNEAEGSCVESLKSERFYNMTCQDQGRTSTDCEREQNKNAFGRNRTQVARVIELWRRGR